MAYHPRLNSIEQWFNQVKHYIKQDKPKTFSKLKESLKNSITPFSVKSGTPNYLVFSSYLFIKSFACINKYLK